MKGSSKLAHQACIGCGICVMPCPVWWRTGDVWMTPHGQARALQGGATAEELADSVLACTMCGACDVVCPEEIGLVEMIRELRRQLGEKGLNRLQEGSKPSAPKSPTRPFSRNRALLPGAALSSDPDLLRQTVDALGGEMQVETAVDDGRDLAWALEVGAAIDPARVKQFVAQFSKVREPIVLEGILHRAIREWAPSLRVGGLAESLLSNREVRAELGPRDLLLLEARGYNGDQSTLVTRFDELRKETGCQLSLDLQRTAIPTTADSVQEMMGDNENRAVAVEWLLRGRKIERIVVESPADHGAVSEVATVPVVHISSLRNVPASA